MNIDEVRFEILKLVIENEIVEHNQRNYLEAVETVVNRLTDIVYGIKREASLTSSCVSN